MYNSTYYNPLPEEYDLVYCHFPDRKRFPPIPILEDIIPYNDPHYCMVLGIIDDNNEIIVVYGTSKIGNITKNDYILKNENNNLIGTGLITDTKWSFTPSNIAILPYNKNFFSIKKFNPSPTVGKFPDHKKADLEKLIHHTKIQNILNDVYDSNNPMLQAKDWNLAKYKI